MAERKNRPLIGVTVSKHKYRIAKFFDWLSIRLHGGQPVFLTAGTDFDPRQLDGLVIGGGDDISADIYGGELALDVRIDPDRDRLELDLLEKAEKVDLPTLGICRGAQMMNIFFGGNLFADIRGMPRDKTNIRTVLARKWVDIDKDSQIYGIMEEETIRVNSLHHQAVDRLGDGLRISGRDRGDFVQAIEHTDKPFFLGVQWHPEFLIFSSEQKNLFRALIRAAGQYRD